MAYVAELGGLVCSVQEAQILKKESRYPNFTLNTPGIRPAWAVVKNDDQSQVSTSAQAIANGADRIVVGHPITQAAPNNIGLPQSPREAVEWTLEEIEASLRY